MPHTDQAELVIAECETQAPPPQATSLAGSGAVGQGAASETAGIDHLAIEEARGENCNRIRELMADKRASVGMPLSDEEREAAIKQAGRLIERHMADYERTGCLASRGNADRARLAMEALIRGRRPQYVAALEKARGLDLPACANEERNGVA